MVHKYYPCILAATLVVTDLFNLGYCGKAITAEARSGGGCREGVGEVTTAISEGNDCRMSLPDGDRLSETSLSCISSSWIYRGYGRWCMVCHTSSKV